MSEIPFSKDKLVGLAQEAGASHASQLPTSQLASSPIANNSIARSGIGGAMQGRIGQAVKPAIPGVDHFQFVSHGKLERRLRITRFSGEEKVNDTYAFEIEAWSPFELDPLQTMEEEMMGQPGSLLMFEGHDAPRVAHGIVTGYGASDSRDSAVPKVRLVLEPRLALLKMRTNSRIYQNQTVPEIIKTLLDEWRIVHRFELSGEYTPRAYATQFQETDFDFVKRIAAREGIFFFFHQGSDKDHEELVFIDDALYKQVPGPKTLRFSVGIGGERGVLEMGVERKATPLAARMSDYDFRNPRLPMRELKMAPKAPGVLGDLGSDKFELYLPRHEAEHEPSPSAKRREVDAQRTLDALQTETILADGVSRVRSLTPAHTFSVEGHPISSINREWVVVSVRHTGFTPEYGDAPADEVYRNEYKAAPVETDRKSVV